MSVQIFLQGKLLGVEEFLLAPGPEWSFGGETLLAARSHWVSLLSEVLPRALLAELGLAKILLGSSGGGQFLVVLPLETRAAAEAFLEAAAGGIEGLSGGHVRLVWALTENLGDWIVVRKRLIEELQRKRDAIERVADPAAFDPFLAGESGRADAYFSEYLGRKVRGAATVGWSPDSPARILVGEGAHTWPLSPALDGIPMARHAAMDEDGAGVASLEMLARRAQGKPRWGVLRGDVDGFGVRVRRLQSVEEHVQLSVMFKQFFAGELEVACSMPEFWRKVTILYSGGDDFAVYGAWDALLLLVREIQRLFHRFSEENLKDFPGPEGKTISMALTLAPELDSPFAFVYEEAGRNLEVAKSSDKDRLHLFGRVVEWRQLHQAFELTENMMRMIREFGCTPDFLNALSGFYREKALPSESGRPRLDRPWRYHRRLNVVVGPARDREFQKLRTTLITELIGKSPVQVKLRPAGRVAVEWARLMIEA